jgi:putative phosphoesterase
MTESPLRFLPRDLEPGRVAACLGLVSDTHLPERLDALPHAVFDVLSGVDLVLHAGDVGDLRVLDELSVVAPVIAVHGNDDTAEAQRELPYQQVVVVAGTRLLLTHAHYPDRAEELASRTNDAWEPKLARRAAMGHSADAKVVVFGHTHVPLAQVFENVVLINPGALAAPNNATRQTVQTVALLFVHDDGTASVTHIDLAQPDEAFLPRLDLTRGFAAAHARFTAPLIPQKQAAR